MGSHAGAARRRLLFFFAFVIGCAAFVSGCAAPETPGVRSAAPRPAVLDHDGGIDDYVALLMLAAAPDYDLLAVTAAYGDSYREPALEASGRILRAVGKQARLGGYPDGLEGRNAFPEAWRRQSFEVAALPALAEFAPIEPAGDALAVLGEALAQAAEPVTVFATGPLTNLAALYSRSPRLVENTREIVVMGGAVRVAGNTIEQPEEAADHSAEYNFFVDPPAAASVFALAAGGLRITLAPLDATNALPLRSAFVERLLAGPGRHAMLAGEALGVVRHEMDSWGYYLWDGAAVLAAVEPDLFVFEDLRIAVHTAGRSQGRSEESREGAGPIRVAVGVRPGVEPLSAVFDLLNGPGQENSERIGRSPAARLQSGKP